MAREKDIGIGVILAIVAAVLVFTWIAAHPILAVLLVIAAAGLAFLAFRAGLFSSSRRPRPNGARRGRQEPNVPTRVPGLTVRSHGERVIAEWLYDNQVRFEYEKPVGVRNLRGTATHRVPDFYLPEYDVHWEHFGMWDVPEYQRKARAKLAMYHQQGYRVICTFGSSPPSEATMRQKLGVYEPKARLQLSPRR